MAPSSAHARQKKSVPRIIPAVPLSFSRAPPSARPATPEELASDAAPETRNNKQELSTAKEHGDLPHVTAMETPMTPDSKASGINNHDLSEQTPASSVANAHDDGAEKVEDTQVSEKQDALVPSTNGAEVTYHPPNAGPAPTSESNATVSPAVELPPAFFPSKKSPMHPQVASAPSTELPIIQGPSSMTSHRPHPSAGSIVFGAQPGTPSVSSTPGEPQTGMIGMQPRSFGPPPGFGPPQFVPPYNGAGHVHHQSTPTAPVAYSDPAVYPSQGPYGHRDYVPPVWPGHPPYALPFPNRYATQHNPPVMNGISHPTSSSHSPQNSQPPEMRNGTNGNSISGSQGQDDLTYPASVPKIDESPYELAHYVTSLFGRPEWADFALTIRSPDIRLITIPVHALLVCRSPSIASAIQSAASSSPVPRGALLPVELVIDDKFVTAESLTQALNYLYGAPALGERFIWGLLAFDPSADNTKTFSQARQKMQHVLSYIAAGFVLQLPGLTTYGSQLAQRLLRWDTLDQVLHFALDGGLPANWNARKLHLKADTDLQPRGNKHDSASARFLSDILDFIAHNMLEDFHFFAQADELAHTPRLPSVGFQPNHQARLSRIRFGDVPLEEPAQADQATKTLSSVLLSLPFVVLRLLFPHPELIGRLGQSKVLAIMRAVVHEREARRIKVLKSTIPPPRNSAEERLLENVRWEECVEECLEHPLGYIPTCRPVHGVP